LAIAKSYWCFVRISLYWAVVMADWFVTTVGLYWYTIASSFGPIIADSWVTVFSSIFVKGCSVAKDGI